VENSGNSLTENNTTNFQANSILMIASTLSITTALFTLCNYSNIFLISPDINSITLLFKIFIFLIAYFIFKWTALTIIGWTYEIKRYTNSYTKFIYNLIKVIGITIFPIYIIIPFVDGAFTKILIIAVALCFALSYIYKFIIFFSNSFKIKFFNHYSILYFCIFEILPILFLLKAVR
jgi:hypothetical protein